MRSFQMKLTVILMLVACASACGIFTQTKPVLRTINDVAKNLCGIYYGDQNKLSIDEAMRKFCQEERRLQPFIDQVLAAKQAAAKEQPK